MTLERAISDESILSMSSTETNTEFVMWHFAEIPTLVHLLLLQTEAVQPHLKKLNCPFKHLMIDWLLSLVPSSSCTDVSGWRLTQLAIPKHCVVGLVLKIAEGYLEFRFQISFLSGSLSVSETRPMASLYNTSSEADLSCDHVICPWAC